MHMEKKKFIVLETFMDSSYNRYNTTYTVSSRSFAEKLGNALIDAYVKSVWEEVKPEANYCYKDGETKPVSMTEKYTYIDFLNDENEIQFDGNLKNGNYKVAWTGKTEERVEIMEANEVSSFEIVKKKDIHGDTYFGVECLKF